MYKTTNILLDTQDGVTRFGGNKTLYLKLLNKFSESLNEDLPAFEKALSFDTNEEFKREIHSLKGVSGNLSANALYESCTALDASLKLGHLEQELYDKLVTIYKETRVEIVNFLQENL